MIIYDNCTRHFLFPLVFADLPSPCTCSANCFLVVAKLKCQVRTKNEIMLTRMYMYVHYACMRISADYDPAE